MRRHLRALHRGRRGAVRLTPDSQFRARAPIFGRCEAPILSAFAARSSRRHPNGSTTGIQMRFQISHMPKAVLWCLAMLAMAVFLTDCGSPAPTPTSTVSPNGSTLKPGQSGSLITSAGKWTFSTATREGGNVIFLNGSQAANGTGALLKVDNGQMYSETAQGTWWIWEGSYWNSTAPTPSPTPKPTP
jgi:hypothetical protein